MPVGIKPHFHSKKERWTSEATYSLWVDHETSHLVGMQPRSLSKGLLVKLAYSERALPESLAGVISRIAYDEFRFLTALPFAHGTKHVKWAVELLLRRLHIVAIILD